MTWIKTKVASLTLLILIVWGPLSAQQSRPTHHHHYKLVDLGTFGGPDGFLGGFTVPVNLRGVVTGCSDSAVLDPNFAIENPIFAGDGYIQIAYRWSDGIRSKLRTLDGGTNACTAWINDYGTMAGVSEIEEIDPLTGWRQIRAVLWDSRGTPLDLGTLGGYGSVAWAINNDGEVTGEAMNDIPDDFSDLGATQAHAFLWQKGVMQDLGTLGGPDSAPYAINQRGQVVGWSMTNSLNSISGLPNQDPFFWDGKKMIDLGSFGGTTALAVDLNDRGQVIGNAFLPGDEIRRAFLWPGRDGKMIKLPTLGGTLSEAKAINSAGDVTGAARLPGDTLSHPVLWTKGKVIDLGVVPGDLCAEGMAINSKQQIVGFSNHEHCFPPHAHGFLWENGVLFDLNQLISNPTTLTVIEGVRITERGEIAGNAVTPEGNQHGVVLIPCDEEHLDLEGCDYGTVEESGAAQASPASDLNRTNSDRSQAPMRRHASPMPRLGLPLIGEPSPR